MYPEYWLRKCYVRLRSPSRQLLVGLETVWMPFGLTAVLLKTVGVYDKHLLLARYILEVIADSAPIFSRLS